MTKSLRNALATLFVIVVAFLVALFSGALNDVLSRFGLERLAIGGQSDAPAEQAAVKADQPATPAEPTVEEFVVPIFDLVRVEPTGDAVLAGQGLPRADVEILSGADVIAQGKANDAGEWAIVLAEPLRPGSHDLTVRVTAPGGSALVSKQSVAVSVPEGGSGEVLVVLNQPGAASTVLQVPGLDEAQKALREAGVDPSVLPATAPSAAAETTVATADPAAATSDPAVATSDPAMATSEPAAAPDAPASVADAGAPSTVPPVDTTAPAVPSETVVAAASEPMAGETVVAANEPASPPAQNSGTADGTAGAGTAVTAESAAPAATEAAPLLATEPAPAGESIPATSSETEAAPAAAASGVEPAPAAEDSLAVAVQAVETENGVVYVAGFGAPQSRIIVYIDGKPIGEARTDQFGRWLLETRSDVEPGSYVVRADQVGADGTVIARAEVPFTQVDPAAPLDAVAGVGSSSAGVGSGSDGEARVGESESVIIRNGDNLWTLAKRLYGRGVRYSTIYEANTDQIRNPDLIYPGQVFILPKGDTNWQPVNP